MNNKRKREEYEEEPHQPLKRARLEGTGSYDNMPLPAEIVSLIFESITREDLTNCLSVCKYWHSCARDKLIGWMPFLANQILRYSHYSYPRVHKGVNIWPQWNGRYPDSNEIYRAWEALYPDKPWAVKDARVLDKEGNTIGFLASWSNSAYQSFCAANENLWRREFKKTYADQIQVDVFLNLRELDLLVYKGETIEAIQDIIYRVEIEVKSFLAKHDKPIELKGACIPNRVPRIEQPKEIASSIKLHNYQLDAISWMKSIENEADM